MDTQRLKRYLFLMMGNMIIALGIAFFLRADLGIDPFTSMNIGISQFLDINFSVVQWIQGIFILSIIIFIDRKKIFVGTVVNMFLVAPLIQFFSGMIESITLPTGNLIISIVIAIIGCIILSIGAGMYLGSDLGMAPYDLIAIIISEKKPISFKWMRIITDGICVVIAGLTGGPIGIGTIMAVFGMGPMIAYTKKRAEMYLTPAVTSKTINQSMKY